MKNIKFLLSIILVFTTFFVFSQKWDGSYAHNDKQASQTMNYLKPQEDKRDIVVQENRFMNPDDTSQKTENIVRNQNIKYKVVIKPVNRNQSAVTKTLIQILGSDQDKKIESLVKYGGTVTEKLDKAEATNITKQLRKVGAQVLVEKMSSSLAHDNIETNGKPKVLKHNQKDVTLSQTINNNKANQLQKAEKKVVKLDQPEVVYLIRLQSAGKNKSRVIRVVRELTNLNLRESKEIVDKLDIVTENLSEINAEKFKRYLENAGAIVRIEPMPRLSNKD